MSYWICDLTKEAAEAHDRRVYNVPAHIGLGWTPYRFRVTHGAISCCAFHDERGLNAWLSRVGAPPLEWDDRGDGLRVARF